HAHLKGTFVSVLRVFTEFGSSELIGVVLFFVVLYFVWKKWWPSLVTLIVAVPGGMLLNEWVKILVHRHRPFVDGPFVDWSGYSFASGHTIGATLLYGQLLLFILPGMKVRHWRRLTVFSAVLLVALVGFSRIALGAHFLTDVLAAMVARPCRGRTLYFPVDSPGCLAGCHGFRCCGLGYCRSSDLSLRSASRPRCNCVAGSFPKTRSPTFTEAALDTLDR